MAKPYRRANILAASGNNIKSRRGVYHPGYRNLNKKQKELIADALNLAVINKHYSHPADLERAAVTLYAVAKAGFMIPDYVVEDILQNSGKLWGENLINQLTGMGNCSMDLVSGLYEYEYDGFKKTLQDMSDDN